MRAFLPCSLLPVALFVLLAGCGARSSLLDSEPVSDPPIAEPPAPEFNCQVSNSARPMLASRLGSGIFYTYPDTSSAQVFTFNVPPEMYISRSDVIARGDRVAAFAYVRPLDAMSSTSPYVETVVLDMDGMPISHGQYNVDPPNWGADYQLVGNANGLFVFTMFEGDTGFGVVAAEADVYTFDDLYAARTDPDSQGNMVVWKVGSNSTGDLHFFNTQAKTFTPSEFLADNTYKDIASTPTFWGSGLLYLMGNPNRLIFEDAAGRHEISLNVDLLLPGWASAGYITSNGHAMFALGGANEVNARYLTTHFATGEFREFSLVVPSGFATPGGYWNAPSVDASGRALFPLYNNQLSQLHATADGQLWQPLGVPTALGDQQPSILERAATIVYDGSGPPEGAPSNAWVGQILGPGEGESALLIRAEPGAPNNPYGAEDELSGDGRCLAYFRNGSLTIVEIPGYNVTDLGLTTDLYEAEMAWIPVAQKAADN
ncbi:MAG: hypothetical protein IPK82_31545 [Polyangiaceae bacterium]|nr:hypothetical protein [Polyangiaceae bacterium]